MKVDPQMPERPVCAGTWMYTELQTLSGTQVNLSSVPCLSLPVSLIFFRTHWPSLFLPTLVAFIFLWPLIYSFLPLTPCEARRCLGSTMRHSLRLSRSLSARDVMFVMCSFVMCSWRWIHRWKWASSIPHFDGEKVLDCIRLVITLTPKIKLVLPLCPNLGPRKFFTQGPVWIPVWKLLPALVHERVQKAVFCLPHPAWQEDSAKARTGTGGMGASPTVRLH